MVLLLSMEDNSVFPLKKRRSVVVVEVKKGGTQTREYSIMVVITVPSCRGGGGEIEQPKKNEGIQQRNQKELNSRVNTMLFRM